MVVQPASTTALDDEISASSTFARSCRFWNPSGPPIPRPADTRIAASVMSFFFYSDITMSTIFTFMSFGSKSTFSSITSPFLLVSVCSACITPGLTVAICGLKSSHRMVAIKFPPNAGLVISRFLDSSSISSPVQSAVSPVWILAASLGARSLPIDDAPYSAISGSYFLIICATAFAYGSVTYSFNIGSSITITLSAPW